MSLDQKLAAAQALNLRLESQLSAQEEHSQTLTGFLVELNKMVDPTASATEVNLQGLATGVAKLVECKQQLEKEAEPEPAEA